MIDLAYASETLFGYATGKALDATFEALNKSILKKYKLRIGSNGSKLTVEALYRLLTEVAYWSDKMEYSHGGSNVELSRLYIDLETHLEPISASEERRNKKISVKSLFENLDSHLILLGRPGSGKTTTIKSICQDLIGGDSRFKGFFPVPIVVRLREVESTASLFDMILELLDIPIVASISSREDKRMVDALDGLGTPEPLRGIDKRIKQNIVLNILNENRVLVVFDGFDEIVSSSVSHRGGKLASKDMFVADFKTLCLGVDSSLLILTSRTADFPYYITGAVKYEISRLSNRQIKKYINNFFTDKIEAQRARASIANKKLLGSEGIPLTLAYLCIIYQKYGRLFHSRRETYNKLLDLLLEDWDINRQVKRISSFASFDVYDKKQFLKHLSYELSVCYGKQYFTKTEVSAVFVTIAENFDGLTLKEMSWVLREIETHTGLFVRSGEGFIFSHKSMQEYLFAIYLYEFPEIPRDKELLVRFPNELALSISFNENSSLYFSYLILNRFDETFYKSTFLCPFLDRLMLEGCNFRIHPYLGLSILVMYSLIRKGGQRGGDYASGDLLLTYFHRFLRSDKRIDPSISQLAAYYTIAFADPAQNVLVLRHVRPIDQPVCYPEPDEVMVSYDFYGYFQALKQNEDQ